QGQLFAMAEDLPEKLTIARNAAYLVEHEVKDLVRAFRAYLNAFRLAPHDDEITEHLWRLAALIGTYEVAAPAKVEEKAAEAEETEAEESEVEAGEADIVESKAAEDGDEEEDGKAAAAEAEKTILDTAETTAQEEP